MSFLFYFYIFILFFFLFILWTTFLSIFLFLLRYRLYLNSVPSLWNFRRFSYFSLKEHFLCISSFCRISWIVFLQVFYSPYELYFQVFFFLPNYRIFCKISFFFMQTCGTIFFQLSQVSGIKDFPLGILSTSQVFLSFWNFILLSFNDFKDVVMFSRISYYFFLFYFIFNIRF